MVLNQDVLDEKTVKSLQNPSLIPFQDQIHLGVNPLGKEKEMELERITPINDMKNDIPLFDDNEVVRNNF